jgi:phosphoserine phosphatase RsbU/P
VKRWLTLAAAMGMGVGALLFLFARHDASRRDWSLTVSRGDIEQATRQLALVHGLDIATWPIFMQPRIEGRLRFARERYPASRLLQPFPAMKILVVAVSPDRKQFIEAAFSSAGRPLSFSLRGGAPHATATTGSPDAELRLFTGENADHFTSVTRGAQGRGGDQYSWEWTDPSSPGMVARFETLLGNGVVARSTYSLDIADRMVDGWFRLKQEELGPRVTAATLVAFAGLTISCWVFFQRLTRRTDHARFPLVLVGVIFLLLVVSFLAGNRTDDEVMNATDYSQFIGNLLLNRALELFFFLGTLYVMLAAGYSILAPHLKPRWVGLQLIARGRILSRGAGAEIVAGLMVAAPLAAIFYLIPATGIFPGIVARLYSPAFLTLPWPILGPVDQVFAFDLIACFALLVPLGAHFIRASRALRALVVVAPTLVFGPMFRRPYEREFAPDLLAFAALLAGVWLLYRSFGVLAVLAAACGISAVHHAATFLVQPSTSLQRTGFTYLAGYGVTLAVAGLVARFGRPHKEQAIIAEMTPSDSEKTHSERERLRAEFSVAQRAQQNMLPAAPPRIPGFSLAAVCRPAREVGGDLYEFPRYPDGRWGLCVADVSGKGVPAALYMTLTKGLLAAISRHTTDLGDVARQLNGHLYDACKHRNFVTMSLASLDPESRTLTHVRAGHNPPLYRSASGETRFLQPPGIGLGLAKSYFFDRALAFERLHLSPGDVVVFYSDGLTEAMNPQVEQFGEERLRSSVGLNGADAQSILDGILENVDRFTVGAEPHDDMTVLVLRVD